MAILAVLGSAVRDVFRRFMDGIDPAPVDAAEAALADAEHTLTHAVPKLSSALIHGYPAAGDEFSGGGWRPGSALLLR